MDASTREAVTGQSVSAAVALLTRQASCPAVSRAEILDGCDPADVLEAMEAVTGGLLAATLPGDAGTGLLRRIGLWAADMEGSAHGR